MDQALQISNDYNRDIDTKSLILKFLVNNNHLTSEEKELFVNKFFTGVKGLFYYDFQLIRRERTIENYLSNFYAFNDICLSDVIRRVTSFDSQIQRESNILKKSQLMEIDEFQNNEINETQTVKEGNILI